ncbi:MAG: hypothetical protein ACXVW7_00515 [Trebonia sp.]
MSDLDRRRSRRGYGSPAVRDFKIRAPASQIRAAAAQCDAARDLAGKLIAFLETGAPPDGLFAPDVFCDFTLPQWRLQAQGAGDVVALRLAGHPGTSRVPRSRFDPTATGFVLEVEEEWDADGESWYCRELFRADIADGSISQLAVY